jgi:predicted permease
MLTNLLISLPFFALIGCGYVAGRTGLMPGPAVSGLNTFVFWFALPALMVRTLALRPFDELWQPAFLGAWLAAGLAVYLVVLLWARLVLGASLGAGALFGLAGTFSNHGYLGLPLVINLLGESAAVPIALAIVVDVGALFSLTLVLAELSAGGRLHPLALLRTVGRGVGLNPLVLSIAAGVVISWAGGSLPGPLDVFTALLAGATGPAALFLIGAALALRPIARGAGAVWLMVGAKLVLHPLAMVAAMVFLADVPPHWALAALLSAAIPSAANVYVLAERYDMQPQAVSTAVFFSTVLALFTFTGFSRLLGL